MNSWHSPGSIYGLGHKAITNLFDVEVQVQEKVDGSFFAFGVYESDDPLYSGYPELKVRSKGAMMVVDAPQAMFKGAVETVKAIQHLLVKGWQYRGEVLCKPKHNALAYERIPNGGVILFDVCRGEEDFLSYPELVAEAGRLGLEVVPQLYSGMVSSPDELRRYLTTVSILGGQNIEGVVIKPLTPMYGPDKKLLMGKFVSEAFKEVHRTAWGESNPTPTDIIQKLGMMYGTKARWNKAIMHMKERGLIEDRVQDIGPIIKEIPLDIKKECEDEIKEELWKFAWPHIARLATRGFPQFYKDQLMEKQFEKEAQENVGSPSVDIDINLAGPNAGVGSDYVVVEESS